MAEEALKIEENEELEVPTGGIGDFVMEDDEADEVYADKAEDFGDDGIAQFPALAERMAKYGRNEDNMLAHVAEGELVIPAQFLEDEVMKQRIFEMLEEAGVEDPEAYIVGSKSNDLNPTTGLPEFFLKKLFKKVVKGIKKVVKAVVKVVKKVAPIILPIAMPFLLPALGPMYGAALGSGIGTLIGGGSIKDALKSALVSGAIGGVTAGFTGDPSKGFFQKVGEAASNPGARFSQAFSNIGEGLQSGSFQGFRDAIGKDFQAVTDVTSAAGAGTTQVIQPKDTLSQIAQQNNTTVEALMKANPQITDPNMIIAGESLTIPPAAGGAATGTTLTENVVKETAENAAGEVTERSFLEKTGDVMFRGGQTPEQIAAAKSAAGDAYLAKMAESGITATEAGLKAAEAAAGPGMLARFGPTALAGTAVAAGAGFFDTPEIEQANFLDYNPDGSPVTGTDLIAQDPGKYLVKNLGQIQLNEETGEYEPVGQETTTEEEAAYLPPSFQPVVAPPPVNQSGYLMASNPGGPFARPYVTQAAEGGAMFPRRNGGIMPNEGTPGEDSVRAMLMPGEFVMTTDAVRGLGNGNLNNGIKNMYSVMRNLERRGRAMA
jgi:LysM repeat protein